ncbi:sigma-70 family RNA polymerase sigma factor [Flavobacterium sp. LS1R49]|uniref:Sigma-70 family RNA polymerase sigma factor n=1 Tax=Flavobacterium shii TaxID=2987687 RepID=A0A9X3BYB3_9FLAO|nr:sigma-70 family RNA polymerase sigma factor [Flavobacterium shii]MCV9928570.1 sigma-70 family RNA polymerase sigma factor [Flavobacterium shii]
MKDPKKFEKTYTEYWEKLNSFSYKMTQDKDLAQNIVQDVFIDLWERKQELDIISIENYLFRAVKNQIFKHYQNNRFDKTILEDKFENYLIENITSTDPELIDLLHILLDKLPEKRKQILLMYKLQDMNIDQIATELQLSKQTVKNQISVALKQLRFELKDLTWLVIYLLFSA